MEGVRAERDRLFDCHLFGETEPVYQGHEEKPYCDRCLTDPNVIDFEHEASECPLGQPAPAPDIMESSKNWWPDLEPEVRSEGVKSYG